ncbi:MAG: thioredoxin family protein [Anaerolineales bacterium]|nr:thioredoxin family protein [Anaerolineales bacterium]
MIWERVLIILLLGLVGTGAYTAFKQLHLRRVNGRQPVAAASGQPTLLYFRSEACAACPTQSRYLAQVMGSGEGGEGNGRFTLQQIDVDANPDQARQYGIMTLPTTMLLDAAGKVREINYGLTPPHKLQQQLKTIGAGN